MRDDNSVDLPRPATHPWVARTASFGRTASQPTEPAEPADTLANLPPFSLLLHSSQHQLPHSNAAEWKGSGSEDEDGEERRGAEAEGSKRGVEEEGLRRAEEEEEGDTKRLAEMVLDVFETAEVLDTELDAEAEEAAEAGGGGGREVAEGAGEFAGGVREIGRAHV